MVVIYRSALQSANPMCQSFEKDLNSPIQKATAYGEIQVAQWVCFHRCLYKTGKIDRNLSWQNVVTESVGETESQASMHARHVTSHCRFYSTLCMEVSTSLDSMLAGGDRDRAPEGTSTECYGPRLVKSRLDRSCTAQ